ncbi:MAG: hypothetical protein Q4B85_02935 [Lachnospiraceae bacterium]|nr:hypothetical protein [Lachnospiraceae bacterium]
MNDKKSVKILFIGNSHTYYNDMPAMVRELSREDGCQCEVTMIAHGGWYLQQHVQEPDVRFNIRYGGYDYVVLQEYTHPFGPEEKLFDAVEQLDQWIQSANAKTVLYMTWAKKGCPEDQPRITEAFHTLAGKQGALLAPVGEEWWKYLGENPETEMYAPDGQHASQYGSWFAAKYIWNVIRTDMEKQNRFENPELEDYLEDLEYIEALEYLQR